MSASNSTAKFSAQKADHWRPAGGRQNNNKAKNGASRSDADNWRAKPTAAGAKAKASGKPKKAAATSSPVVEEQRRLPTVIPEGSPLRTFLDETDCACNDTEFIQRLQDMPCELKLKDKWVFWLESNDPPALPEKPQRDDFLKLLTIARTVSNLSKAKEYALQACEHPDNAKIFLFKQGIKPVWEDRSNYNGGRLFVTCTNKAIAVNTFVTLVIKLLSGYILAESELTGLTVSFTGSHRFTVQVWNRNSAEKDKIRDARKVMKKMFKKNVNYQVHRTSLKIYKFGYEQVMPEIEKAQAAKEAKRADAADKLGDVVRTAAELDAEAEKPSETILDQASKAILAAALSKAWDSRESVPSN